VEPLGKLKRDVLVVRDLSRSIDEGDKTVLLNVDRIEHTSLVDHDHSICVRVPSGHHAELVGELLPHQERTGADFVHEQVTKLGDDEENSELGAVLAENGEVSILLNLDLGKLLESLSR